MRRNYLLHKEQKPFINTYHINEVPLPYYNPFGDPSLQKYFNNHKKTKHIQQLGIIYSPKHQYPYHQRRHKNAHKFLKDNLCKIPDDHFLQNSEVYHRSQVINSKKLKPLNSSREDKSQHVMPRRKAESDMTNKSQKKRLSLVDMLPYKTSRFQKTQRYSPLHKSKSPVFLQWRSWNKKRQNAEEEPFA